MPLSRIFYRDPEFFGERSTPMYYDYDITKINVSAETENRKNELLSFVNQIYFFHFGILRGEYIVLDNGLILLDRNGIPHKINTAEKNVASQQLDILCCQPAFIEMSQRLLAQWDQLPYLEPNTPILSDPHTPNYFHFTLQTMQFIRYLEMQDIPALAIAQSCLQKRFQVDLFLKVIGTRKAIVLSQPARVRDPMLIHSDPTTHDSVLWLREKVGLAPQSGPRRLYIPRRNLTRVAGFGISEDESFQKFLTDQGFETIDFGTGEKTIEEQVMMLNGANIIISPQGSTLVNTIYLNKPLSIIEIQHAHALDTIFPRTSLTLGFDHHTIICEHLDADNNMIIPAATLQNVIQTILAKNGLAKNGMGGR
jgi:hypothetical protein